MATQKINSQVFQGREMVDIRGLTDGEAASRLKDEGYNELPATKQRSFFAIDFSVAREPMFLLRNNLSFPWRPAGGADAPRVRLRCHMGITFYQERKT
jgi:P-type Ca2+ transporter type 2C